MVGPNHIDNNWGARIQTDSVILESILLTEWEAVSLFKFNYLLLVCYSTINARQGQIFPSHLEAFLHLGDQLLSF